jgi:formate/nitrite transporter FocA (FNT family)
MGHIKTLVLSIFAGLWIGIGGTVYLSVDNKIIGSFLFSIGLFVVVINKFNLFTGKVGYAIDNKPSYLLFLLIIWIGNFIGTFICAAAVNFTRISDKIGVSALEICRAKLNDNWISIFILSVFCGLLMHTAVNGYKMFNGGKDGESLGKYIAVILPVAVFILCGFEHCVASMFYFSLSGILTAKSIGYILIMTGVNALGGIIMAVGSKEMLKANRV